VIPVYNGARFFVEIIQSILNQTFSDFEPLLINDGSTDESFDILNADPEVTQSRKAEVSLEATQRQCVSYLDFGPMHPKCCVVVDANQEVEKVLENIIFSISERLAEETERQHQDMFG
jgi:GT2 family glycosyltransferase